MRNLRKKTALPLYLLMIGGFSLMGCTDNNYDSSSIDTTVKLGGDTISLPSNNSTDSIKLDDILKLNNSDCVTTLANGDYVFSKSDNSISPSHPEVGVVSIQQKNITTIAYNIFTGTSSAKGIRLNDVQTSYSMNGSIVAFDYSNDDVPSDIVALKSAQASATMTVNVSFASEITKAISTFKTLNISFPKFIDVSKVTLGGSDCAVSNNKIALTNVSTSKTLSLVITISGLNFESAETNKNNSLKFDKTNKIITVKCYVDIDGTFDITNLVAAATIDKTKCNINTTMSMPNFRIQSATGNFKPSLKLENIGNVTIDNVPDFLTGNDVNIDLANPQIVLGITSDLPVKGLVSGEIISTLKNGTYKSVSVPEFYVKSASSAVNTKTTICICRDTTRAKASGASYDEFVQVPTLSTLIQTIPKSIRFNLSASADASVESTVTLGKSYTISPEYAMTAPIAFGANAKIVYRDTLSNWNKDIKDINLSKGGRVEVSADAVSKITAYLTLSAYAVDVNGDSISTNDINIEVENFIPASSDGKTEVTKPITVKIYQNKEKALSKIDGVIIKAEASAAKSGQSSVVTGVTLNSKNQTLVLKNISIKLIGGIIGDFN